MKRKTQNKNFLNLISTNVKLKYLTLKRQGVLTLFYSGSYEGLGALQSSWFLKQVRVWNGDHRRLDSDQWQDDFLLKASVLWPSPEISGLLEYSQAICLVESIAALDLSGHQPLIVDDLYYAAAGLVK